VNEQKIEVPKKSMLGDTLAIKNDTVRETGFFSKTNYSWLSFHCKLAESSISQS
jgi:hypothetical protein